MESTRISIMVLLVGLANIAADISRLLLEPAPRTSIAAPLQARSVPQTDPGPMPEIERRETEPSLPPTVHGPPPTVHGPPRAPPPRGPPDRRTVRPAFSRLPPDFSINQPPWCPACRQQMRR
jgi:hypothetical protein